MSAWFKMWIWTIQYPIDYINLVQSSSHVWRNDISGCIRTGEEWNNFWSLRLTRQLASWLASANRCRLYVAHQMLCSDMTLGLVSSCNFHLGKLSWALCQIYFLSKHTESYIFRIVVYVHILARNISTCSISIESNYYILCTCTYMIWLILLEVYTNEIWNTIKSFNPWIHFWIIRNAKCEWRLGSWNWPRGNGWGVNQLKMWLLGFM